MKKIKKIAPIHLVAEAQGKAMSLFIIVILPVFVFIGFLMMIVSFSKGSTGDGMIGLLCVTFFGGIVFYLIKGGEYKPQKSFYFYRFTKEKLKKFNVLMILISLAVFALAMFLQPKTGIKNVGYLIAGLSFFYYMNKSIKVHDDVDYVANMQFADLIGLEVDEKVNASYQNFDPTDRTSIQENSNIFLVSNRKMFFAFYNGTNWLTTTKKIEEIEKIGVSSNGSEGKSYLKLVFVDGTKIGLRMCLYDKLTSNPSLFIKQFLETLDAYLLGYTISNRSDRRRVSVGKITISQDSPKQSTDIIEETVDNPSQTRIIDINESILKDIKQGISVEPGRTIEL